MFKKQYEIIKNSTKDLVRVSSFILCICLGFPVSGWAGGVALGATRVVYPANSKQVSLPITNTDEKSRFLIQSWVENDKGEKTSDFVLTPPLFLSKPSSENTLRIIYSGEGLPTDKESLYWLNSKSIPSLERDNIQDKNLLQIAVLARIKLFVRPADLPTQSADAPSMLTFKREGKALVINNPSPYYVTLVNMKLGSQKIDSVMVSPKSQMAIDIPVGSGSVFSYQTINDYGANTPTVTTQLN
ncbi:fimbria/pilus periplasmic chaperone [Providencia manganoxydans]|uniref:fimbria/pilus periplasmic chaperone n=1 Tax=Providencia manganoxydans TaxID=2923283 RepID=UPI0032DB6FE9